MEWKIYIKQRVCGRTAELAMHTNMMIASTFFGPVPDRESKDQASRELMPYLASTADMTNPDKKSRITGLKNADVTTTAAFSAWYRWNYLRTSAKFG